MERCSSAEAILEGIRSEKATRGYGSIAMDVNDDNVAPCFPPALLVIPGGSIEVTTATG